MLDNEAVMYAENCDVLLSEAINHQISDLTVYVHQPSGLPSIEYAIKLWVLVDEALQKLSKQYVRQAISDFVLSVIIAEG